MKTAHMILMGIVWLAQLELGSAGISLSWSVSNVPAKGLEDITFPIKMAASPHATGFYYAQQYNFVGLDDVGYTGIQPRPDSGSKPVIHAVFSSFVAGSSSKDANCHDGADTGAGVSCAVEVNQPYSDWYELEVRNTGGTTWTGTLINKSSGVKTHIGSYTLPSKAGGIKGSQMGFVEYFPWNSGSHKCNELPFASVSFGIPTTTNNKSSGSLNNASEDGDCVGKTNFKSSKSAGVVSVEAGFKSRRASRRSRS